MEEQAKATESAPARDNGAADTAIMEAADTTWARQAAAAATETRELQEGWNKQ